MTRAQRKRTLDRTMLQRAKNANGPTMRKTTRSRNTDKHTMTHGRRAARTSKKKTRDRPGQVGAWGLLPRALERLRQATTATRTRSREPDHERHGSTVTIDETGTAAVMATHSRHDRVR